MTVGMAGSGSVVRGADGGAGGKRDEGLAAGGPTKAPAKAPTAEEQANREFLRAENEDDDGYDPYSDRRPVSEPLFERDPWA